MNDIDKIIEAARDAVAAYNDRFEVPGRKWVGPIDTEMEALRKALVRWQGAVARRSLQSEVSALREDADRWRFYDKAALASWRAKGVERIGEWLTYDAVMQFGSRNAAIDAARGK